MMEHAERLIVKWQDALEKYGQDAADGRIDYFCGDEQTAQIADLVADNIERNLGYVCEKYGLRALAAKHILDFMRRAIEVHSQPLTLEEVIAIEGTPEPAPAPITDPLPGPDNEPDKLGEETLDVLSALRVLKNNKTGQHQAAIKQFLLDEFSDLLPDPAPSKPKQIAYVTKTAMGQASLF